MYKVLTIGLALLAPIVGIAGPASVSENLIGLTTPNGKTASDMLDLWFNQHKPGEAFDRYVSRTDITDHHGKNTVHSFEKIRAEEIKITGTKIHFDIKQIIAQGDLVFAHVYVTHIDEPKFGGDLIEIMRFKDGKMVEHWNIHVPIEQDPSVYFGTQ